MSVELKYKKPSALLQSMVGNFTQTFQSYMKNSAELLKAIQLQAEKEGIPKEQLRKIIEEQLTRQGLAKSSIRRILPPELKNQNMVRKQPKKDPLVKNWDVELDLDKFKSALQSVLDSGQKKAYVTHDNKRVIDVGLYE